MKWLTLATLVAAAGSFAILFLSAWGLGTDVNLQFVAYWGLFFAMTGVLGGLMQETTRAVGSASSLDDGPSSASSAAGAGAGGAGGAGTGAAGSGASAKTLSSQEERELRKEMNKLERQIAKLDQKESALNDEMAKISEDVVNLDTARLAEIDRELTALREERDEIEMRWMEVGEELE